MEGINFIIDESISEIVNGFDIDYIDSLFGKGFRITPEYGDF